MTPQEKPLTTGGVARLYGVSNSTVRRWVKTGRLPSFRTPSGQVRVWPADAERVASTRTATPDDLPDRASA
jgi:excisionase family DNA binding protein